MEANDTFLVTYSILLDKNVNGLRFGGGGCKNNSKYSLNTFGKKLKVTGKEVHKEEQYNYLIDCFLNVT